MHIIAAIIIAAFAGLLATAAAVIIWLRARYRRRERERESEHERKFREWEAAIRADNSRRSRTSHLASIGHQLAPVLPGFGFNPKEAQWIGGTIDYVVWNGLEGTDPVEVVFVEVKTGRKGLQPNQRRIRDAVEAKRVRFKTYEMRDLLSPDELSAGEPSIDLSWLVAEDVPVEELADLPDSEDDSGVVLKSRSEIDAEQSVGGEIGSS